MNTSSSSQSSRPAAKPYFLTNPANKSTVKRLSEGKRPNPLVGALFFLGLIGSVLGLVVFVPGALDDFKQAGPQRQQLEAQIQQVWGEVVGCETRMERGGNNRLNERDYVTYRFVHNEREYTNTVLTGACDGFLNNRALIYYLPSNPTRSGLNSDQALGSNLPFGTSLIGAGICFVISLACLILFMGWRRGNKIIVDGRLIAVNFAQDPTTLHPEQEVIEAMLDYEFNAPDGRGFAGNMRTTLLVNHLPEAGMAVKVCYVTDSKHYLL